MLCIAVLSIRLGEGDQGVTCDDKAFGRCENDESFLKEERRITI